ncbi:hypothetical protein ASU32_19055 [Tsukamurella tyrosinosolvens]|nr:hypothetical protein ASU32_19055 [Tsukamurella tyrosinosolvens]
MTSPFVIDAIEQAIWSRQREGNDLAARIKPSTGAVGSSYDNTLAESVIGLYKTELIKPQRPWKGFDDLEIATAEWVDWFSHRRPFEYCDGLTPAEAEQAHYAHHKSPAPAGPLKLLEGLRTRRGGSDGLLNHAEALIDLLQRNMELDLGNSPDVSSASITLLVETGHPPRSGERNRPHNRQSEKLQREQPLACGIATHDADNGLKPTGRPRQRQQPASIAMSIHPDAVCC